MSISPVSDIVLDVARAADPARSAAAEARLARLAEVERPSGAEFAELVAAERRAPIGSRTVSASLPGGLARTRPREDSRAEAVEGLERLVLQKLVESMLPKETSTLFGRGTAGDVWRSMLAEQLATQIASSVDLGLARAAPRLGRSEPSGPGTDRPDGERRSADPATGSDV